MIKLYKSKEPEEAPKYPYVGKNENTGVAVLFVAHQTGFVADSNNEAYPVNTYSEMWIEHFFDPIAATITFEV